MGRRKKKGQAAADNPWDAEQDVVLAERTNLDSAARREKSARRMRRAVKWSALMAPVVLVFGFYAIGSATSSLNDATALVSAQSGNSTDAPGKAQAIAAVQSWLDADPSPIPDGHVISWDGSEAIAWPVMNPEENKITDQSQLEDQSKLYKRYVHSFTVQVDQKKDDSGNVLTPIRWYKVQELVAYSSTMGAAAIGTPSIIPDANAADPSWAASEQSWPYGLSAITPQAVSDAVGAWVTAFTSGSPTDLRVAVSDPDTGHSYAPLTGIVSAKWSINYSAYKVDAEAFQKGTGTSDTMMVNVTLTLDRGDIPASDTSNTRSLPTATYDLLVTGASSGSAKVVAWGAPNTAQLLTPYENATTPDRTGETSADTNGDSEESAPASQSGADDTQDGE